MATNFIELMPRSGQEIDPVAEVGSEIRERPGPLPWLYTNMISSLDGATAVHGLSGGLGGPADRQMFRGLRASAQAIIVGASTAAEEKYRPALANNDGERPPIVVISANLNLTTDLPFLQDSTSRPIIATVESAPPRRSAELAEHAELLVLGEKRVDLTRLLTALSERGIDRVLLEGGPRLNAQFIAADLVDEWNLTLAPLLVAGDSPRPAAGTAKSSGEHKPTDMHFPNFNLTRLWQCDSFLFGRWTRAATEG